MPVDKLRKFILAIDDIEERKEIAYRWKDHQSALEVRIQHESLEFLLHCFYKLFSVIKRLKIIKDLPDIYLKFRKEKGCCWPWVLGACIQALKFGASGYSNLTVLELSTLQR